MFCHAVRVETMRTMYKLVLVAGDRHDEPIIPKSESRQNH